MTDAFRERLLPDKPSLEDLLMRQRNAVIEECARVAETWHVEVGDVEDIAAAIRALKDKP